MSAEEDGGGIADPDLEVEDAEDYVDKRVKKRILEARARVDEREDQLFNERLLDPEIEISNAQATVAWGNTVRQFARNIEVLLEDMATGSEEVKHYLDSVQLGTVRIPPPDTERREWSKVAMDSYTPDMLRREFGLSPSAELPEVREVPFKGLRDIVERESHLSQTWVVTIDDSGPPPEHEHQRLQATRPVPKWIYENAVRAADRFLHEAGIGVKIRAEPYMGEGGPGI